mmetsp:Transcript_49599/g.116962  ORF Transcript_49599/g.116962 Transcript_49599/m.116962 type:complete len:521 (+) Transcript_49599:39-1601(+)
MIEGEKNKQSFEISTGKGLSMYISINAIKGLQEVVRNSLGPNGSLKILVSGSGEIKISKNGTFLLKEMQIQNPVASLIARTLSSQHQLIGDGTISVLLILGELFNNLEGYLEKGIHPQILCEGIDLGRRELEKWLPSCFSRKKLTKETLIEISKTVLCTKIQRSILDKMAKITVEAILTLFQNEKFYDLNMIEIIKMDTQTEADSRWVRGIVLDHGARHPDMPKIVHNAFILACNVDLEYEKTETNSSFFQNSIEQQERFSVKEREAVDIKIHKIIHLKRKICKNEKKGFVVINQKGIDIISLDMLSKEGILGVRRTKRRNMERISLLCNCVPVNSLNDLKPETLGFAGVVYEQTIGEEKYTFIENTINPFSGTILIKGKNSFFKKQIEESLKMALKTLKLCIQDKGFLLGGGEIEKKARQHLLDYSEKIRGKKKFGIKALAESFSIIPKVLDENCGNSEVKSYSEENPENKLKKSSKIKLEAFQILDCFSLKKQIYSSVTLIATQILLIDDILIGKGLN